MFFYHLQLYSIMKVVQLKLNEELPQKDYMHLDMIYLYHAPPGCHLQFEITRYLGGQTNQNTAFLKLEQGQVMDYFKMKNGGDHAAVDTKDYIVRKITLVGGRKIMEDPGMVRSDSNDFDFEEDLGFAEHTTASVVVCPHEEYVKVYNVRNLIITLIRINQEMLIVYWSYYSF